MNQCEQKMDEFLDLASDTIKEIKKTQESATNVVNMANSAVLEMKKIFNLIKWMFAIFAIALISEVVRLETTLANKPNKNEVVTTEDAVTVHMLNVDNIQKISNTLTNDPLKQDLIESFNIRYMEMVKNIYLKHN